MGDNPVKEEVKDFKKDKLKKTETSVKSYKPTKEDIEEEKKAMQEGK